jgi:predicted RNase H-like nuclease (RuvC/YqgF family)
MNEFIACIGNNLLVKKLKDFGQEEFAAKKFLSISQGDILFVQNPSSFSQKIIDDLKGKVKVIITSNVPKKWEPGFVFIKPEGIIIRENNNFAIAKKSAVEEALRKKDILKNIVEEYRKERVKEK